MLWLGLLVYFLVEASVCCQLHFEKQQAYTVHEANSSNTVVRGVMDKGFSSPGLPR